MPYNYAGEVEFPALTIPTPTVTGATKTGTVSGVSTFQAQTPAVSATTSRAVRLFWVAGLAGELRWSVLVTPAGSVQFDVQAQVLFLDDASAQVGRWAGPWRTGTTTAVLLGARLAVPRKATKCQLRVVSLAASGGATWTEKDTLLTQEAVPPAPQPPERDAAFGVASPEGVAPPAPSAGLPGFEARSAARRSPQVRYAQEIGSTRPDQVPKQNARGV